MLFSKALFSALASAMVFAGGAFADDDCESGPMNSLQEYGYPGRPYHFCWTKWKTGAVVTGMEVFATSFQIKGVTMTWSDGTKITAGQRQGDRHDSINWKAKSEISKMRVAPNAAKDGIGMIHIEVDGKTLHVGSDIGDDKGEEVPVGAGILLGHKGDAGAWLTSWGPLFLGASDGKAEITHIAFDDKLDDVNKQQKGIQSQTLMSSYIRNSNPKNSTDGDQSWSFNGQQSVTTSTSFTTSSEEIFSMSVGMSASATFGIPLIAEVTVEAHADFGYEYHEGNSFELTNSHSTTVGTTQGSSSNGGLLKPGHAVYCTTTAVQGKYDGGYTATIRITVEGKAFEIERHGNFEGISWVNGATDCRDMLVIDIPGDAENVTDAKQTVKRAVPFLA